MKKQKNGKEKKAPPETLGPVAKRAAGVVIPPGKNPRVVARPGAPGAERLRGKAAAFWVRLGKAGRAGLPLPAQRYERWLVRCLLKAGLVRVEVEKEEPKKAG